MKLTAPSAIVVTPTISDTMEALQIAGIVSLSCVAAMSLLYGEIILLHKF
jgi:hypothetical protein